MKKINIKKKRIGILGGTFDPPHKGHLYISKISLKNLKLNKIIWVITKKNPFKSKPFLNIKKRISLSKEITKKEIKISIKYFDNKVKSVNTYKILKFIKKKNKGAKIFFILGADNLKKFHKWSNWEKIPNLAKIIIFPRKNYSIDSVAYKKLNKKDFIYMNSKKINISSSLIRKFW